jgi:chemotaxis-related protein WspD
VKLPEAKDYGPLVAELQLAGDTAGLPAQVVDCWSTIGVHGNGTCRELQKIVHCRNCSVYSAAGIQLLDRPLPADYRRERTGHYAEAKEITPLLPGKSGAGKTSLVIFRLGNEWLALPTTVLQEVAEQRPIHTLPHRRRSVVLGLVNVRGELTICVSVARLLGLEKVSGPKVPGVRCGVSDPDTPHLTPRTSPLTPVYDRMLVVNWDGQRVVFPVDEMLGVHRLHSEEMKPPPATIAQSARACTRGVFAWRERSVGFLDADLLFNLVNRSLA